MITATSSRSIVRCSPDCVLSVAGVDRSMLRELIGFARVAITPASSSALSSGSLTSLRITCGCNDALTDDLDALQPGEEVCCRGGEGLRIFARGGGVHLPYRGRVVEVCLRPGAGLPRASVVGIGLRVAIGFAGGLLMHAAAVRWGDLAALVLGASGLGKSTFAAATIRSGGRVLSDDLVLACSAGDPPRGMVSYFINTISSVP